ncbi:MAG: hypothetical protein WCP21_20100, partial [Armatimonadota bacterium]
AQPTTGGAAGAGAPLVTQHSQALSQQFAQSTNDPAEKARLKRASRQLQAGRLAGQKAKGEITRSRGVKGSLKSLAGKSTHHRSSSAGAKFAHQHRTPSASRVAHSQPTGAHAHRGPTHA